MADWDLLLSDVHVATMCADVPDYAAIRDAAIAINKGRIAWIGPADQLPANTARETRTLGHRWVTPALIDCHTHLVFGGDRAQEYEQRLRGASYESIAAAGGGILDTVRATRAADIDTLHDAALERINALAASGVATIEIKSGYGLDISNEIKMLAIARRLDETSGVSIQTSLLAAHAIPIEHHNNPDAWVDQVCDVLLPEVAERQLADAVDAYCESIAFNVPQITRIFQRAQSLGLPIKLHADQLSDSGGAELAAQFNALSADHLEYASPDGVAALARAGSVAVLLPGAYLTLNETQQPPVDALREHGVPIAVATDLNPGTSALLSVPLAMAMGSRLFGLTPEECLAGATREAARALGLTKDRGTIEVGKRADVAIWDIGHPRELSYWLGGNRLYQLLVSGKDR